jgi:hypothetical protein
MKDESAADFTVGVTGFVRRTDEEPDPETEWFKRC